MQWDPFDILVALVVLALLACALLGGGCAGPRERVILLPGSTAPLTVTTTAQGTTTLSEPFRTATVSPRGIVTPGTITAERVQAQYGALLATQPSPGRTFVFYFETGTSALTAASEAEVPVLLADVAQRGAAEVEITGHTDQAGSPARNLRLSQERAEAVQALLLGRGVQTTFVRLLGLGSRAPLVDRPGQAEARNRRVEVTVR